MANSLIRGLLAKGFQPSSIIVADVDNEKLEVLSSEYGIRLADNQSIAREANVVVLAVKPQVIEEVCTNISLQADSSLVVSDAAGTTVALLEKWLGNSTAIIRSMPNTPALIGKGATGLFANKFVSGKQKDLAKA